MTEPAALREPCRRHCVRPVTPETFTIFESLNFLAMAVMAAWPRPQERSSAAIRACFGIARQDPFGSCRAG